MDHSKRKIDIKQVLNHKLKVEAATKAEGRTGLYNPLLQKPVALEPVGPGSYPAGMGGYAYIGPPPDFGGSYGAYVDTQGRKQYGIKSSKQFSIYDGSPVQMHSELNAEERDALLSQMGEMNESYNCESCRAELTVSAPIQAEKVHCPYCSSVMEGAVEKIKNCYSKIEEKQMSTGKPAPVAAPAAAPVAPAAVKAEADIAKEAMKVDAPKEANEAFKAPKAADMIDPSNEKGVSKDTPLKELDLDKETKVKSATEKEKLEAAIKRRERLEAARKTFQERKRKSAVATMKKRKEVKAKTDSKKAQELRRELRIMATFQPAKFAEIQKNPRLAAICAEVSAKLYSKEERAQVRAELSAMAEHDPIAADKARKELDFVAPEILMEESTHKEGAAPEHKAEHAKEDLTKTKSDAKPAEAELNLAAPAAPAPFVEAAPVALAPAAPAEAKKEDATKTKTKKEEKSAEAAAPAEAKKEDKTETETKAEAMAVEHLAALSSLKGERIEMSLHGEEGQDPFWNVIVDAEPVGRIHLGDQENAEAIRAGFVADSYAQNFAQAMQQVGVEKMLSLAKARLFAHRADDGDAMARVKAAALAEAKTGFDEKVSTIRQDFVRSIQTAMMASDKNLYGNNGEEAHALKGGLFQALAQLAIEPKSAVWAIEAGFETAPQYFDFITQKAIEIMDMPKEARESFENIVKSSGKMELAVGEQPEEESLRDRLVKASLNASAMGTFVGGEDKEAIRENLGLSANRR